MNQTDPVSPPCPSRGHDAIPVQEAEIDCFGNGKHIIKTIEQKGGRNKYQNGQDAPGRNRLTLILNRA